MINIMYASNQNGFKGILLSVLSILENTKEAITVHLLSMNATDIKQSYKIVSQKNINQLERILKSYNESNEIILYDLREIHEKYLGAIIDSSYTPYAYLRLFANKVLKNDKVIYLDIDTMVCGDIKQLYDIDISNYEIAAVNDAAGTFWIKRNYFNSGVLLINFKRCNATQVFEKCLELIKNHNYFFVDQTPLNKLIQKRLKLNRKFNEQRSVRSDTVIKHFCQRMKYFPFPRVWNIKQWDIENVHKKLKIHKFDGIYQIYDRIKDSFEE